MGEKFSSHSPDGARRKREACLGLGSVLGLLVASDGCLWRA